MQKLLIRRLTIGLFVVYTLAVTWPVATLIRSAEPLIFGIPLSMAWSIGWILMGWLALLVLDRVETEGE